MALRLGVFRSVYLTAPLDFATRAGVLVALLSKQNLWLANNRLNLGTLPFFSLTFQLDFLHDCGCLQELLVQVMNFSSQISVGAVLRG